MASFRYCVFRLVAGLLLLLALAPTAEGRRRKARAQEVEVDATGDSQFNELAAGDDGSGSGLSGTSSGSRDALHPQNDDSRLVTFRNHYDNQTLLILWTGTVEDESHISSPVLVSEVEAELDGQVNTFPEHVFLVQAKETLKIIGDKIVIGTQYLYHLGPVPSAILTTSASAAKQAEGGGVQEVKTVKFKSSQQQQQQGARTNVKSNTQAGSGGSTNSNSDSDSDSDSDGDAAAAAARAAIAAGLPRPHPNPRIKLLGTGTTAMSAKFRSLVPSMDMWYEDGRGGTFQGTLTLGKESTTNTYEGHVFYFTDSKNKKVEYARFTMDRKRVLYIVQSDRHPVPADLQALTSSEESFMRDYKARTGINWRHYYGPSGPRPPPTLFMWPATHIGQTHTVTSTEGFWTCRNKTEFKGHASSSSSKNGGGNSCQTAGGASFELEVVSLQPRVFFIKNFFSDAEADEVIEKASARLEESTVGNKDAGGSRISDTRTSRNSWVKRQTSAITESLFKRAADLLQLEDTLLSSEKNAEEMQVVRYVNGQKYDSHHDWGVSGFPESRFITLLLYLTEQPTDPITGRTLGGETAFPKGYDGKGFKVHAGKGNAILFYNLLEDGNGDDLALHAALPVEGNHEKLLCNYWVWDPKRKSD